MSCVPSRRQHNLDYLHGHDLALWSQITALPPATGDMAVLPAKKEGTTLRVGRAWVHSKYHPRREAEQLTAADTGRSAELTLHFGLGLGYLAMVDGTLPAGRRLVFEPDPNLLQVALEGLDLPTLYEQYRVQLFIDEAAFGAALEQAFDRGENFRVTALPFYPKHYPAAYDRFRELVRAKLEAGKVRQVTLAKVYPHILRASLQSLWHTTRLPAVDGLVGGFKGKPAVILAAGPSLERNLVAIKPYRDKIVLFAVARVVAAMERHGLTPDFLVHTESKDYSNQVYGVSGLAKTCLLLSDQCHPDFFRLPARHILVYQSDTNLVTHWKTRLLPQLRHFRVDSGGSVANDAFSLAFAFGCDPIILTGQDLAVSRGRSYFDGARNRAFPYDPEHVRPVPGYFGTTATSLIHYVTFIHWYEEAAAVLRAQGRPTRLINATEGGAALRGFTPMRLDHVLAGYRDAPGVDVAGAVAAAAVARPLPVAALRDLVASTLAEMDAHLRFREEFATFAASVDEELVALRARPLRDMTFYDDLQRRFEWYYQAVFTLLDETPLVGGFCHQSLQALRDVRRQSLQIDRALGADALFALTERELTLLRETDARIAAAQQLIHQTLNQFCARLDEAAGKV